MSFKPVAFESSRVKEKCRQDIREAREKVLSRAKEEHDRKVAHRERAKQRGDDKWMLPSVEARLEAGDEGTKKSKKHKKHKKKKKKHKKRSSSESDSSSDSGNEWVEKPGNQVAQPPLPATITSASEQKPERDEWMTLSGLIPCVSVNELRHNRNQKREAAEQQKNLLDQPGQSVRELNPYWRDGGSGLPQAPEKIDVQLPQKAVGDQGVGWLRKALQRVHEQAAETGRSADEIAAERWGSLEKLENLLAEAEGRKRQPEERSSSNSSSRSYHRNRNDNSYNDRRQRDRHHDKERHFMKPSEESESHRKIDRTESSRHRHQSDDKYDRSKSHRAGFSKPSEDSEFYRGREQCDNRGREERSGHRTKDKFMKPETSDDYNFSNRNSHSSGSKNWQKQDRKTEMKKPETEVKKTETHHATLSISSSSDEESLPEADAAAPINLLSDKELNDLGAKIVKAEIFGNDVLAKELKSQLEAARKARDEAKAAGISSVAGSSRTQDEVVILTRTDSRGVTRPLEAPQYLEPAGGRRKKQKVETHKDGERVRYFPDDDKYRLQDMFTKEKLNSVEDSNYEFARLIGKGAAKAETGEADLDDMFEENARFKESDGKMQRRDREQAVREHQRVSRALDGCRSCVDSKQMLKHLIIALGTKVYLSLPSYKSLTEGHCLLAPTLHSPCATQLDEDVWAEMQTFRKALTKMFSDQGKDVVFFETARNLRNFPHMVMECVPLDQESGNLAPIYFKKAILECETEWSTNKKLVELAGKGVRRSIPKGLPYFAVCFGNDDGFGHVIEDEKQFPYNFAQEIIGGILDLDHQLWRKKQNENFEQQRKKVLAFAKDWAPYDFTNKKKESVSSSSDSD